MDTLKAVMFKNLVTLTIVRFNEPMFELNILIDITRPFDTLKEGVTQAVENNINLAVEDIHEISDLTNEYDEDDELKQSRSDAVAEFLADFKKAETLDDLFIIKHLDDGYCEEEETNNISYISSQAKSLYIV